MKSNFPRAKITYVYGSSEGALIAKTTIDYYLENDFAFNEIVQGIDLSIVAKDKNNIGKIKIKGKAVLYEDETFTLSDLAYLDSAGLHIVGREKYSTVGIYNYLVDNQIRNLNPKVRRGFFFIHQDKQYFAYEGELTNRFNDNIIYLRFKKLKMDAFASVISNNLNIVMKVLAIVTIVMSVPTMIFSAYGMNVNIDGMPFAQSPWGFLIIIATTALVSVIVTLIFNKLRLFK